MSGVDLGQNYIESIPNNTNQDQSTPLNSKKKTSC